MAKVKRSPPKLSRKQLRKQQRLDKKKRKHQGFIPVPEKVIVEPISNLKHDSKSTVKQVQYSDKLKFEKLQRSMNAERIKRLKEDNVREDKLITSLEKKLKLNVKKKKCLSKSFINEGLDYLLEVCDFDANGRNINLEAELNDIEMKSEIMDGLSTPVTVKLDETPTQDSKCDISINLMEEKNPKSSKKKKRCDRKKNALNNAEALKIKKRSEDDNPEEFNLADECYDETFEGKNDENDGENILREDIYGRLRKNDGTVVEKEKKYIPPQLRNMIAQSQSNSEKLSRLKKQLKGLLNRLTGKNMHSIATQIEQMFGCNSRHDMNSTLTELLKESIISYTFSPMRIIVEHALLISILHGNVGIEVGSYVLEKCVEEYRALMNESAIPIVDKRIDNIIAILVQLYNFKVFHACLIYEILDELLERFQEKDIDLVLLIFKNVGFNLRKDDPSKLKEVIFNVKKKANSSTVHSANSRMKFMLETLLAIKNNNKLKVLQIEADYIESLKKLSKTMLNSGKYVSELKITLGDLLNVESKGRWWIVGSAWQGIPSISEKMNLKIDSSLAFDEKLLNLARKHRMSTDIRKNIFCILMSAEDFMDAFEKLLKLGLKGNQSEEVIYVTMHCLLQEKVYNPYYSFIAEQFSSLNRKYQIAIQFCSWDKFKEINSLNHQQISNLAEFLAYLIQNRKLSLSVLKVLQFTELDKPMLRLIRQLLLSILLSSEETVIAEIFASISKSDTLFMLRESLQLFLRRFILKEAENENSDLNRDQLVTLPRKVEVAENAMRSANSQYDFN